MKHKLFIVIVSSLVLILSCYREPSKQQDKELTSWEKQIQNIDSLLAKNPKNDSLWAERALLFLSAEQIDSAYSSISKALLINSNVSRYHVILSDLYLARNSINNCRDALLRAIELDDENIEALSKLAELYFLIGDYEKSYAYLNKITDLDPNNAKAYFMKGYGLLEQGDTNKAIAAMQRATQADPNYYEAFLKLGQLLSDKDLQLADEYYKAALRIQPNSEEALYMYAYHLQNTNRIDQAIEYYQKIITINPINKFAYYNLGYIYLVYKKDFNKSIYNFTQSIEIDSSYAEAYYNRGLAYEQLGENEKAISDYKTSLKYKTNFDKAIKRLNALQK